MSQLEYVFTQSGEVFSTCGRGPYSTQKNNSGYLQVRLKTKQGSDARGRQVLSVHRMVALAHLPNPNNLPQVNHINGNKLDNRVENLEWVTASDNLKHAFKTGLKELPKAGMGKFNELHSRSRPINQLTKSGDFVRNYPSIQEAGRDGFNVGNIVSAIKGETYKSTGGYKWEYSNVTE